MLASCNGIEWLFDANLHNYMCLLYQHTDRSEEVLLLSQK